MTVYTKTIVAALAVSLGVAPLVGTVNADSVDNSNANVAFANETGSLELDVASDLQFGSIDLSSIADFYPVATNMSTGKLLMENTLANPTGTYSVTVQQTGDWVNGGTQITKSALPVQYDGTSTTSAQNFVSGVAVPNRGEIQKAYNYDGKNFTLDLTGSGDLSGGVNKSLQSELTWTLLHTPA